MTTPPSREERDEPSYDDPWYEAAERIADKAEQCGPSQLAYNIAALVSEHVRDTRKALDASEARVKVLTDALTFAEKFVPKPDSRSLWHHADGCAAEGVGNKPCSCGAWEAYKMVRAALAAPQEGETRG